MPIPNCPDKFDSGALTTPAERLKPQLGHLPDVPPAVVLGYQHDLTEAVAERATDRTDICHRSDLYWLDDAVGFVGDFGFGAPISATITEDLVACGAEAVCILGGCGVLQREITPDDAILATSAIRDEGASNHYLPADQRATASADLVDALDSSLAAAGVTTHRGRTWTTSAFYRETAAEVEAYADDGVLGVDMEAAAMLAVAAFRDVDAAVVHSAGDYLTVDGWNPRVGEKTPPETFLTPTLDALREYVT